MQTVSADARCRTQIVATAPRKTGNLRRCAGASRKVIRYRREGQQHSRAMTQATW